MNVHDLLLQILLPMKMQLVASLTLHKTQLSTVTHLQADNWELVEPELFILAGIKREPLAPRDPACLPASEAALVGVETDSKRLLAQPCSLENLAGLS